jgi:HEAT repeat protein
MTCTQAREFFPELLSPRTAPAAQPLDASRRSPTGEGGLDARTHLASCPECQREFSALSQTLAALDAMPTPAPTPRLRKNFYAMLEEEKNSAASLRVSAERERRAHRVSWLGWIFAPIGAAALLAAGFFAGQRSAPATAPAPAADTVAMREEIKTLQAQVSKMGQLVGYSLLQQQSRPANDRLRGVLTSATLENPNDKTLNDLIGALATDPSANVRLRALEALFPHADQEVVRAGVLASLPREQNPLVQVSMIDFLAAARDREAAPALEKISDTESADQNVRAAAKRALTQL